MAFDITSVLKGVSGPDTGKEQIEYIPVDQIDPDPNFYSLEGLDELAGNIELIGLQQPLRVRPGEDGRFIVVSGHRRRAAILMIRDGGNEMFRDGIPCIVDRGEESPAMRELRLIYANASTRVMGPAEISKQAERTEMLLYQLKEEGIIEFPGRTWPRPAGSARRSWPGCTRSGTTSCRSCWRDSTAGRCRRRRPTSSVGCRAKRRRASRPAS